MMYTKLKLITTGLAIIALTATSTTTLASDKQSNYCMDVVIEPFHMLPDMQPEGSCTVRDYWDGQLQKSFFPFTSEEHLFNCEYFGPVTPLPTGDMVPSAVVSDGKIVGTIGGHAFEAKLACASLTNWYQDSCADPANPQSCNFQMAQPFMGQISQDLGMVYPRVTEVSILDGVITVDQGRKTKQVPVLLATRAAGITHLENTDPLATQVGASITHSLLGMVTYDADDEDTDTKVKVLKGSADMLLQGHIFYPTPVDQDPSPAVIKGSICSKDLYKRLNRSAGRNHHDDSATQPAVMKL